MIDTNNHYGTKDRQLELLEMMEDVDRILRGGNIRYSLCGGTLLGAIRENGFIPWDDDIDIMVDRKNLNRLERLFQRTDTGNYALNNYLWVRRIQKRDDKRQGLCAATIDVFVMDNCPDNPVIQTCKVFLIRVLQGMMKEEKSSGRISLPYRLCLTITRIMGRAISYERKLKLYSIISQIGNRQPTKYLGGYDDTFYTVGYKYNRNMFSQVIYHPFESLQLPITAEYNNNLSVRYGDYMTPPAEKERVPIHLS